MGEARRISFLQIMLFIGLAGELFLVAQLFLHASLSWSILVSVLPLGFFVFLLLLKNPYLAFFLLFTMNYFVMGMTRYIPALMGGVLMDVLVILVFLGLFITSFNKKWPWNHLKNGLTIVISIWFLFCILNVLNPKAPLEAWIIGIRRTAFYFFTFPILTFLLLHRYKNLKMILLIWSVFVLLAVLKALLQKYAGFDSAEMRWLYAEGKARTHIIYSGIRYFSFFTDAANFGCAMAFAMVFFSISALYINNKMLKIYFIIVSIFAAYGMLISGTRVAIAIPFVGYALFALLSRNAKVIISGTVLLAGAFIVLNFTMLGQSNSYIRRVRTAFHPEKDASFLVRMENQEKMRTYMADKPFGVGIGTSKAAEYSNSEVSKIPTDSWLVMVWVETGIIGLILYLCLIGYVLVKGTHIVLFKIKNKELWGIECAFLSGITGMFVASYANEVIAQFPNGPIIYMGMAFIFMAGHFDREVEEGKQNKAITNGEAA